jgi:hypothetical protein
MFKCMRFLIAPAVLVAFVAHGAPRLAVYQGNGCSGVKRLPEFTAWLGRKPDLMLDFFAADTWQALHDDAGWTLGCWQKAGMSAVFSVPMLPHGKFSLREGATGAYDNHFRDLARELVRRGFGDAIIRLGWEFNGGWYPWMAEKDPKMWVEYWRRIVSVMRSVPDAKLRFDWCPAQGVVHVKPDTVYPGDDVVDIIGQDLYNQTWTPHIDTPEQRWDELVNMPYGLKWHREFARAHGKPESYPEWGTGTRPDGHGGGDDAYFIERMAEWLGGGNVAYHGYWDIAAPDFNARLSDGHQPLAARSFQRAFGQGRLR